MRIRRDSLFISSVLFTIALLCLVPWILRAALAGHDRVALQALDAGFRAEAKTMADLGVACLAIILIGLIVVWTGYIKRERWTWLVMFIVVWVWAFPLLVLPLFKGRIVLTISEWLYSALYQPGSPRMWAESVLIFVLLVIALLLPIKSFFLVRELQEPSHRVSPRLVGFSVMGIVVVIIALFTWIHVRVYEIPLTELNSTQRLAPPPPPPFKAP
jgi:hypothetical protein